MPLKENITEAIEQAEWALVPIQRSPAKSQKELRDAVASFRLVCRRLTETGPGTIEPLRKLIFSTNPLEFNKAQTAARILPLLQFPEIPYILLEAALSPDTIISNRGWQNLLYLPKSEDHFRMAADVFNEHKESQHLLIDAFSNQTVQSFYPFARQCMQENPNPYVRRSLVNMLIAGHEQEAAAILRIALDDNDNIVRIRSAFGLVLYGERELLSILEEAAGSKAAAVRAEAVTWLSRLPLPSVVHTVLKSLKDKSTRVRMDGIAAAHDLGVRESLLLLRDFLDLKSIPLVEQAAVLLQNLAGRDMPYDWKGRRLTSFSVKNVRMLCQNMYDYWDSEYRYLNGRPMNVTALTEALFSHHSAYWILVGMTGHHFDFVPGLDPIFNWEAANKWKSWAHTHEKDFKPGHWYYLGEKM